LNISIIREMNPRYQNQNYRLSKQLNVMQTTHLQQPDQFLNLNERHTKYNTSVSRESQTLNAKYTVFFWQGRGDNKQCKIYHD